MFSGLASRKSLSGLEQRVMEYVWSHPRCTADDCRESLGTVRSLKDSTVRTILRRLEDKGYVRHEVDGRTYRYLPAEARDHIAVDAVRGILDRFWGGSVEQLLVGMVDNHVIRPAELEQLARKIALRKKERK